MNLLTGVLQPLPPATLVFLLALVLVPGVATILWPLFRYRRTKRDGYLTMLCVHGVISSLNMVAWTFTVVWNGYPTFLPFIIGGGCLLVCLLDLARLGLARSKPKESDGQGRQPSIYP
jgi:hypothetical protein